MPTAELLVVKSHWHKISPLPQAAEYQGKPREEKQENANKSKLIPK
jgi:hypothetical protein